MGFAGGASHWLPEHEGIALREITLGGLLREQSRLHSERPALIFDDTHGICRYTYVELDQAVDRLAKALIAVGVGHEARVAVMAANSPEWVLLEYALARIGAVLVTVNPAFRRAETRLSPEAGRRLAAGRGRRSSRLLDRRHAGGNATRSRGTRRRRASDGRHLPGAEACGPDRPR
ncbi:AMP-binding protein [Jiella pelagia]|uniref:AMP-binding protein n=1 Tax=Jiella pelagia TaxID=2986949 RepID=A0ABY7BV18_9HYPH|nr:AMP-binding protein [Jiella pelagia]